MAHSGFTLRTLQEWFGSTASDADDFLAAGSGHSPTMPSVTAPVLAVVEVDVQEYFIEGVVKIPGILRHMTL